MSKSKLYRDFSELLIRKFESNATIKTYKSCAYNFIYDNHPDSIEKLSNTYLLKYITNVKLLHSHSKYNQTVSVLKILYNEMLHQKSKLKGVKCIKIHPKLKILPDFKDVWIRINGINNIKHRAILSTLLTTGLRVNELINIKISDIDSNSMKILVRKSKGGGNSEYVILTTGLLWLLRKYFIKYKPKEYLFEGIKGRYSKTSVTNIVKKYIGESYSPHWLRSIAITHMVNSNITMPKTKLFSRHKSDSALYFYYHYDENTLQELRQNIDYIAC